jgi:hypothetical protein
MCDVFAWSFDVIAGLNFIEIAKALAAIVTALVAYSALKNWKRQDKAKRETEFLDSLVEHVHAYIIEISKATLQKSPRAHFLRQN